MYKLIQRIMDAHMDDIRINVIDTLDKYIRDEYQIACTELRRMETLLKRNIFDYWETKKKRENRSNLQD